MKYLAFVLAAVCCAATVRAESEDPSYEPNRNARRSSSTPEEKSSKKKSKSQPPIAESAAPIQSQAPIEVQATTERRVLVILNGRPVYEDDADAPQIMAEIRACELAAKNGSRPKENFDASVQTYTPPPVQVDPEPTLRLDATGDLTADKPGAKRPANQKQLILEDFRSPGGVISSRAERCYGQIGLLKTNVETISRCMDNRGKENALLVHSSEEVINNINAIAAIWPTHHDFIDACAVVKRDALILNNELNQTPWRWAEVRWSFAALVKSVVPFRELCRDIAAAEPAPHPKCNGKGQIMLDKQGMPIYEDAPDIDPVAARKEAHYKATHDEIARIKRNSEIMTEDKKNKIDFDLDGNVAK